MYLAQLSSAFFPKDSKRPPLALRAVFIAVSAVKNTRITVGRVYTPFGEEVNGFKVTIGGVLNPEDIKRTYEDIDKVFKSNPGKHKVHDEHDENGKFKSFIVET